MARPPIIISNGGVAGELATGINDPNAERKIMANMDRITVADNNGNHISKVVVIKKGGRRTACLYWRLTGPDTAYPRPAVEGATINAIVDEQE